MKFMLSRVISVIFAFVLVFSINSGEFIMPISVPLGKIPFPYLFWILLILYAFICGRLLKLKFDASFASRTLLFGVFFHIILLLLRLHNQESAGLISFVSNIYRQYFKFFVLLIFTCVTVLVAYRILRERRVDHAPYDSHSIYDWPLIGLFVYILLSALGHRQYQLLAYCSLIFIISAIAKRQNKYFKVNWVVYLKEIISRTNVFPGFIFLGGLGIRVIYLLRTMTNPNYLLTGADSPNYHMFAATYLKSGIPPVGSLNLAQTVSWVQHIGFWQYLALFYKLFHHSYFIFCFFQAILGSTACIFVYFISKYFFNKPVARIAAIFSMLNFSMIFSSIVIDTMGLNLFCTTLIVLLLCRYENSPINHKSQVLLFSFIGLMSGFLIMTFLSNIVFLILVAVLVFMLGKKRGNLKKALAHSGIIVLFSLIAIFASLYLFGIENIKSFILVLFSRFPETSRFYSGYLPGEGYVVYPEMASLGLGGAREIVLYSIPVILEKGIPAFKIITQFFIKNFSELFFSQNYGGFDPVFLLRSADYFYCLWFYAYMLTIFGAIVSMSKGKPYRQSIVVWLVYLYIIFTAIIHIIFFRAEYRYRSLMEPYLIIFGSFGLWILYQNAKGNTQS